MVWILRGKPVGSGTKLRFFLVFCHDLAIQVQEKRFYSSHNSRSEYHSLKANITAKQYHCVAISPWAAPADHEICVACCSSVARRRSRRRSPMVFPVMTASAQRQEPQKNRARRILRSIYSFSTHTRIFFSLFFLSSLIILIYSYKLP